MGDHADYELDRLQRLWDSRDDLTPARAEKARAAHAKKFRRELRRDTRRKMQALGTALRKKQTVTKVFEGK